MADIEALVRRAYAAFGQGDVEGLLAMCDDDMTFFVPGETRVSGDHPKAGFVEGIVQPVMEISQGTFSEEILEMSIGDDSAAVMLHHHITRDGEDLDWHVVHWWHVRDGKFSSWWEFPHEYDVFTKAWS